MKAESKHINLVLSLNGKQKLVHVEGAVNAVDEDDLFINADHETIKTAVKNLVENGYEIVRTGEHSYTYAHLTPLCFSDVNRTDDPEWAEQATQTTPQIIFKQLNLNVLKAPTLDKNTEGTVDRATNELTYTFNWTQENIGTETPTYSIKLFGLLTDSERQGDRSGANCAEGHPDADTKWQQLYPACQRGYHAGQRQRQLAL